MLVINDLGPQYQDLHHTEAGRKGGEGAATALQLLPTCQMRLVRVAHFNFFSTRYLMKCKCDWAENKQLSNVWKVHYFWFQTGRRHHSAISAQHWLINNQMVHNETILCGHGKRSSVFKETLGFAVTADTALINRALKHAHLDCSWRAFSLGIM